MGIDYGHGKTNIDNETGIRYGVIHSRHVSEMWNEDAQPIINTRCPHCGYELTQEMYDEAISYCSKEGDPEDLELRTCPSCNEILYDCSFENSDPVGYMIDTDEIKAVMGYDDYDIMVIKSPYYTKCEYCSPCAPGACTILSQHVQDDKAYCFGPDAYEESCEKPVIYRVSDDSIVE